MYPAHLFNLFPPFPREDKVFVAMCFHPSFNARWKHVIEPAIREIGLEPYRVDTGKVNDSILTDITKSISSHRLIFADISAMGKLDTGGKKPYVVRNGNVMYEVGVAQAVRLPEEVILFRSDDEELPFDVVNIRVHEYDPDRDPDDAKRKVTEVLRDALVSIDQSKSLSVEAAAQRLDHLSFGQLSAIHASTSSYSIDSPENSLPIFDRLAQIQSIGRLLNEGLIRSCPLEATEDHILRTNNGTANESISGYQMTEFGIAVHRAEAKKVLGKLLEGGKALVQDPNDGGRMKVISGEEFAKGGYFGFTL